MIGWKGQNYGPLDLASWPGSLEAWSALTVGQAFRSFYLISVREKEQEEGICSFERFMEFVYYIVMVVVILSV